MTNRLLASRPPLEAAFVVGGVSQYAGAAIAVGLFPALGAPAVAFLRVLTAGIVLTLLRRPWRRSWKVGGFGLAAVFGIVLAGMNLVFYFAIDRIPLGTAVAIEFIGPVTVAALTTRTHRSAAALVLAAGGVGLLAGVSAGGSGTGVALALLAAVFWAGYIILGHRVSAAGLALDGLAVGLLAGAVAILPAAVGGLPAALAAPGLLGLGAATGVLSNVVPYGIDQIVMGRMTRRRFAVLEAILPATATIVGAVALAQLPGPADLAGVVLVGAAVVLAE